MPRPVSTNGCVQDLASVGPPAHSCNHDGAHSQFPPADDPCACAPQQPASTSSFCLQVSPELRGEGIDPQISSATNDHSDIVYPHAGHARKGRGRLGNLAPIVERSTDLCDHEGSSHLTNSSDDNIFPARADLLIGARWAAFDPSASPHVE